MKFVGLLSGGKDSLFAVGKALSQGHKLLCTANLSSSTEADSFMFQTCGTPLVPAISASLGVPLVTRLLRGQSSCKTLSYTPTTNDEVEDLYELLLEAKYRFPELEAVVSGAVLSDYQRIRVENVCSRLGLTSLSPLWRFSQHDLLVEMKEQGYRAVIIKISSMGLQEKHLGAEVSDLIEYFEGLHKKFGFNQAGEGGEYETLIIDAPIMRSKLIILESETTVTGNSAYSPYGHLIIKKLALEDKNTGTVQEFSLSSSPQPKIIRQHGEIFVGEITAKNIGKICNTFEDEVFCVLKALKETLEQEGLGLTNLYYVNAYLKNMGDFAAFNAVYVKFFSFANPPARVCVELGEMDCRVKIAAKGTMGKKTCTHVQSVSSWAPASIGPYSQAYALNMALHLAGSIPLIPQTMTLSPDSLPQILSNCLAVAQINGFTLSSPEACFVYYTGPKPHIDESLNPFYIKVTNLPKNSPLELEFHLQKCLPTVETSNETIEDAFGKIRLTKRHCTELVYLNWHIEVERAENPSLIVEKIGEELEKWLSSVKHKSGVTKGQLLGSEDIVVRFEDFVCDVRIYAPEPERFKGGWLEKVPASYLHSETTGIYICLQDYLQMATYQFINAGN